MASPRSTHRVAPGWFPRPSGRLRCSARAFPRPPGRAPLLTSLAWGGSAPDTAAQLGRQGVCDGSASNGTLTYRHCKQRQARDVACDGLGPRKCEHPERVRHVSERAEIYLRLLAEVAVRTAPQAPASLAPADRVHRAAEILVDAGAIDDDRVTEILLTLGTALRLRRVPGAFALGRIRRLASMAALRPGQPPQPPAALSPASAQPATAQPADGTWQVIQEVPPAGQGTGSRVMALIVTSDRMIAPATLRFPPSAGLAELSVPSFADLTASDDAGTSYLVSFTDGAWAGSTWTGTIMLRPVPPPAARLLTIVSGSGPVLHVDLAATSAAPRAETYLQPVDDSPGERLLHRRAESLLGSLGRQPAQRADSVPFEHRSQAMAQILQALSTSVPPTPGLPSGVRSVPPPPTAVVLGGTSDPEPDLAELVATLEGAGVLSPLSAVPAEVAALGQALGVARFASFTSPAAAGPISARATSDSPAATGTSAGSTTSGSALSAGPAIDARAPASLPKLPARWATVLAYYGRRHQPSLPSGTGSIGAVLPEVDGARFVVAGARTGAQGAVLYVIARGLRTMTPSVQDTGFSWWVRDESGGWHLGVIQNWHLASDATALRLTLLPPLRPGDPGTASILTLEVTGRGHRLTASLRVCW